MSTLGDIGLKICFVWYFLELPRLFARFPLDLFGSSGFFGIPDGFDIFKCTFDSLKRLGRGCAPLLNKAFHFTRVFIYKRLPCIIDPLYK